MLADTLTVRKLVRELTTRKKPFGSWTDKAANPAQRLVAFGFFSGAAADTLACKLQKELHKQGYTNTVERTSADGNEFSHNTAGEYVRVRAAFTQ